MTDLPRHFASDEDGVRHVVLDSSETDPSGWVVLVWAAGSDPTVQSPSREGAFASRTVWGQPGNLLGFGDRREAWVALVDHDEVAAVDRDGDRWWLTDGRDKPDD